MPLGAPPHMKISRCYSGPGQYVRMHSTGLVVRSCSDWCPEPVTQLDLDTCWHHPLSPASLGKWSTQGSLSRSGYPADSAMLVMTHSLARFCCPHQERATARSPGPALAGAL